MDKLLIKILIIDFINSITAQLNEPNKYESKIRAI